MTHSPPFGTGVLVGVAVVVAVCVPVAVRVAVDVIVAVAVALGVLVGVAEGVGLTQVPLRPPLQEPPAMNIETGCNKLPGCNKLHVVWSVSTHLTWLTVDVTARAAFEPSSQHPVVAQLPPEQFAPLTTFKLHALPGTLKVSQEKRQVSGDWGTAVQPRSWQWVLLPTFSQEQQRFGASAEYARPTNSAKPAIATTVQRAVIVSSVYAPRRRGGLTMPYADMNYRAPCQRQTMGGKP